MQTMLFRGRTAGRGLAADARGESPEPDAWHRALLAATVRPMVIRDVVVDLDNCLAAADEPGEALFAPAFEAMRAANHDQLSDRALDTAFADCWRHALDFVARKHGFCEEMLAAGWRAFRTLEVERPLRGYGDLDALGVRQLFAEIHIDAIDESPRSSKRALFAEIAAGNALGMPTA